jgi:hypothetical protein
MTTDQLSLFAAFDDIYGFPMWRLETVQAKAGAAMCQSWGAKLQPEELLPKFTRKPYTIVPWDQGAAVISAMGKSKAKRAV